MASPIRAVMIGLLALATVAATKASAGDGDYDPSSETGDREPVFFGFVRDTRGSPVADARVSLSPKNGKPLEIKTNVLGLYRSHMSKEFPVEDVSVSCEKPGYKQANVIRRTQPGSSSHLVETNCTLQRI